MDEFTDEEPLAEEHGYSIWSFVLKILSYYGWYIVLGVSAAYYLWTSTIKKKVHSHTRNNPVLKTEAIQNARQKLQEKYDAAAKTHAEKIKEEEENKKQHIKDLEDDRKKNQAKKGKNKIGEKLTPDYFPLMNAGPSRSFRPAKGAKRGG